MNATTRLRFALLPVCTLIAFASCQGGKSSRSPEDVLAERMVLSLDDFGDTWTVKAGDALDSDSGAGQAVSQQCTELAELIHGGEAKGNASSGVFTRQREVGVQQVQSTAQVYDDVPSAQTALEPFDDEQVRNCIAETFATEGSGEVDAVATLSDVAVNLRPAPDLGDQAVGLSTTALVTSGPLALPFSFDLLVAQKDRVVTGLFIFSAGEPLPDSEHQRLLQATLDRSTP